MMVRNRTVVVKVLPSANAKAMPADPLPWQPIGDVPLSIHETPNRLCLSRSHPDQGTCQIAIYILECV